MASRSHEPPRHDAPGEVPARREHAFGEDATLTPVDRFGIWLSARSIRRHAGGVAGRRVGDFGCGHHATLARELAREAATVTAVDVSLAPSVRDDPRIVAVEGPLPAVLAPMPDGSFDLVLCVSVLEHLDEPGLALREFRRLLAPGGRCLINVPTWLGKRFLELSAFRLGLSPAEEMDDHRRYYDPKDLWPELVRAGFRPRNIRCFRHKGGLNTFAVCRVPDADEVGA
jgi:SAM-dependent methyltransferase